MNSFFAENFKHSTIMRVFLFLVILLISSLIGGAISMVFMFASDTGMRIAQGLSSIMMFVVPPIVYHYLLSKAQCLQNLGLRKSEQPGLYLLTGALLMFVSLPITNMLTAWNEGMSFGGALSQLEEQIKALEETAQTATEKMLNVDSIGGLLLNLVVIALIPAVGEELTFRGLLQQSLTRRMNPHVAILIASAIFSFIHFQFYGFLPRLFLGMMLGYMFYTSGSLWTSILMHFVNNATAVVLYYLNYNGILNIDAEHFGETQSVGILLASAAVTAGLIVWCWWKKKK